MIFLSLQTGTIIWLTMVGTMLLLAGIVVVSWWLANISMRRDYPHGMSCCCTVQDDNAHWYGESFSNFSDHIRNSLPDCEITTTPDGQVVIYTELMTYGQGSKRVIKRLVL